MDIENNSIVTDVDTEVLDSQITKISKEFAETYFCDEEDLEMLVAKAMKLGELYERKKWQAAKAQAVPDGFVVVPVQCPDPDFADSLFDELSKKAIGEFGDDLLIHFSDIDEEKIWALMLEAARGGNHE